VTRKKSMAQDKEITRRDVLKGNFDQPAPQPTLSPEQRKSLGETTRGIGRAASATATVEAHQREQAQRREAGRQVTNSGESSKFNCMALPGMIVASLMGWVIRRRNTVGRPRNDSGVVTGGDQQQNNGI